MWDNIFVYKFSFVSPQGEIAEQMENKLQPRE